LVYFGRVWSFDDYEVGRLALATAASKTNLGFAQAVALGTLCNLLVCLAVWLTYSARTTTDKLLAVVPPVAAFVASSFEHSVANMYTIPLGLLLKGEAKVVALAGGSISIDSLTIERFLLGNLVPVTLGNILGGAIMVGLAYWLAFKPQLDTDRRIPPSGGATAGEGGNR
jgi:formate transporter